MIMPRLIKLSNIIINPININRIVIEPNRYLIHLINEKTDIKICQNKNPEDYKRISEWMNPKFHVSNFDIINK
jgi:hypothetical protein